MLPVPFGPPLIGRVAKSGAMPHQPMIHQPRAASRPFAPTWCPARRTAQRYCRSAAGARGSEATDAPVRLQRRVGRLNREPWWFAALVDRGSGSGYRESMR